MSNELTNQLVELRANPTMMHRRSLENCKKALGGNADFFNGNSPFVLATENTATHFSAFMKQADSLVRRMYPTLAVTEEDLYYHMTEKDFDNRFALPSSNPEYVINFNLDELKTLGTTDAKTGATKIIIPWSTVLKAGLVNYGFFYDLSIVILKNGGVRCSWEGDLSSGIIPLTTNIVDHDLYRESSVGATVLRLFFPVYQYQLTSKYLTISNSGGNKATYMLTDYFFTCRVWNENPLSGKLEQLPTTHAAQSYDSQVLTAVLKVTDGVLVVDIPDIYTGDPRLGKQLRVDIYTTLGEYTKNLADLSIDMFAIQWRDLDKRNTMYSSVLSKISMVNSASVNWTNGGRNALSVAELRKRVTTPSSQQLIPITPNDQTVYLDDRGMTITPILDNFSDRVSLTTKDLTSANNEYSESPLGMMIYPITLDGTLLSTMETVVTNGDRITLKPETLYRYTSGTVGLVSDSDRKTLDSLMPTELISIMNANDFVYSPYHYVLDRSSDMVTFNAYYLDKPSLLGRMFIDDNPTVPYVLAPNSYSFRKVDSGYVLEVTITKDEALDNFKPYEVFVQAAFVPSGERRRVYLTGTYVGVAGENQDGVFRFEIDTNYVLNRNHSMSLQGFKANLDDRQPHFTDLVTDLELFVGLYGYKERFLVLDPSFSDMDKEICLDLLSGREALVLSKNRVTLRYGDALPELYSDCRSAKSQDEVEVWDYNVMSYYEETVLKIDSTTGYPEIVITDGEVSFIELHQKGDPEMVNGVHKVLYPAGSTKYDQEGKPIISKTSGVIQYAQMLFIDARYNFVNEESLVQYRDSAIIEVIEWLVNDVRAISPQLLGRTELYLAPTRTMGTVNVNKGDSIVSIDNRQRVKIDVWVTADTYANMLLRSSISKSIRTLVTSNLQKSVILLNDLQSEIKEVLGGDITGCMVKGLGINENLYTFNLVSQDSKLALAADLAMRSDGKLILTDALEIEFIKVGF